MKRYGQLPSKDFYTGPLLITLMSAISWRTAMSYRQVEQRDHTLIGGICGKT